MKSYWSILLVGLVLAAVQICRFEPAFGMSMGRVRARGAAPRRGGGRPARMHRGGRSRFRGHRRHRRPRHRHRRRRRRGRGYSYWGWPFTGWGWGWGWPHYDYYTYETPERLIITENLKFEEVAENTSNNRRKINENGNTLKFLIKTLKDQSRKIEDLHKEIKTIGDKI